MTKWILLIVLLLIMAVCLTGFGPGWVGPTLAFSPNWDLLAVGGGSIRLFRVKDILS